jgi:imidazolonepropionase
MTTTQSTIAADGVWHRCNVAAGMQAAPDSAALYDAALVVRDGALSWVGPAAALSAADAALPRHDGGGAWVTPGLIDCHTHLVYGGQRAQEFAMRLAGAGYEEIARAGGGILSTVRATRETGEDRLFELASGRLQSLLDEGVVAIEIKSGYGLDLDNERKQLRVARRWARMHCRQSMRVAPMTISMSSVSRSCRRSRTKDWWTRSMHFAKASDFP